MAGSLTPEQKTEVQRLFKETEKFYEQNKFEDAIVLLDRIIEIDQNNATAWNNRGYIKSQLGQDEEAIEDYNVAIKLDPSDVIIWINRGISKNDLSQYREAIIDFDEAIKLDANNAATWNNRGISKNDLGQYREAIEDFDETIKLDSKNATAWNNRGYAKCQLDQNEEAIEDYSKAIELDPKNAATWNDRGYVYFKINKFNKSERDLLKSLELDPEFSKGKLGLLAIAAYRANKDQDEQIASNTKEQAEIFKGLHDEMMGRKNQVERSIHSLDNAIFGAWIFILLIVFTYFWFVISPGFQLGTLVISDTQSENLHSPFRSLFYLSTFFMLVFPFIWGIRILMTAKEKLEILREDYYRRAWVDATIRRVFTTTTPSDDDEIKALQHQVWAEYIAEWTHHSPAEMMLQYRSKSSSSNMQSLEILLNECRKVLPGRGKA